MAHSSADVRQFLMERFSDEEIEGLCFDHFPEVQADFSAGMAKGEKIQRLLVYCHQRARVGRLFAALAQARPDQYPQYFGNSPPPDTFETDPGALPDEVDRRDLLTNEKLLDLLIANQSRYLRDYVLYAAGLVAISLACIFSGMLLPGTVTPLLRGFVALGGLGLAGLSARYLGEVFNRREKLGILELVKLSVLPVAQDPLLGVSARRRVDDLLWQVIERTVVK